MSTLSISAPVLLPDPTDVRANDASLLMIDQEIDILLDHMQEELEETGEVSEESQRRFVAFCEVFGEKVDRIGRFIRIMENRAAYCKAEAARLSTRAKVAEGKAAQTKQLVLYFLNSRDIAKIEGPQFTLRRQKNSTDTVNVQDASLLPIHLLRIEARFTGPLWERIAASLPAELQECFLSSLQSSAPLVDEIKQEVARGCAVEGVRIVRGHHLRIA